MDGSLSIPLRSPPIASIASAGVVRSSTGSVERPSRWTRNPQSDPCFEAFSLVVDGSVAWPHAGVYSVVIVTDGTGVAETAHGQLELSAGDTIAVLAATASLTISGDLKMLVTTPSFV